MMKLTKKITLALLALTGSSQGAITFSSSLADNPNSFEVGRWSSAATVKSQDIDGNNIYGSDGYIIMNTANDTGGTSAVLFSALASSPSYTSAISYTGAGAGSSGSFNGSEDALAPDGVAIVNVGYAGLDGSSADAIQELFSYTMNRDMAAGETIRVGVIADSLGDPSIGITSLRMVAGATNADATMVTNDHNGSMDMYFFDITGLSNGDDIEIWGSNGTGNTRATIGGVTFDSIVTPVPEPSSTALLGLGGLALILRRKK